MKANIRNRTLLCGHLFTNGGRVTHVATVPFPETVPSVGEGLGLRNTLTLDNMAASNHNCTITTVSNSGRFRNYGAVQHSSFSSGTLEHPVQATDTIEGLAIKYSVTVSSSETSTASYFDVVAFYVKYNWRDSLFVINHSISVIKAPMILRVPLEISQVLFSNGMVFYQDPYVHNPWPWHRHTWLITHNSTRNTWLRAFAQLYKKPDNQMPGCLLAIYNT